MRILHVPMENAMGKTKGTAAAPDRIMSAYRELCERLEIERRASERLELDLSNLESCNDRITERVSELVTGDSLMVIGGDHSLTYASFRGFAKKYPNAGIIVFDAHPDMMHAFRPPTHEDYLLTLLSENILSPRRVLPIGLRSSHPDEQKRLEGLRILRFPAEEIETEGLPEILSRVMAVARKWEAIYLSIDIDVLDPAYAPATGYQEPGGLSTRELLYALRRLRMLPNLKMIDLVEVNPELEGADQTIRATARILYELLDRPRPKGNISVS